MTAIALSKGRHARSVVLLAGCVSLVMALLVTAVTAAVGLGGLARLGGLLGASPLDYARGPLGEFFPLSDSFVQDELGATFGQSSPAAVPVPLGSQRPVFAPTTDRGSGNGEFVPLRDDTSVDLRNDDFAGAYAVRGLPFSSKTSQPSERQADEPTSCAPSGGTRWFRYTPRSAVGLLATTRGSDLGAALGVFTGSGLTRLRQEYCANDPQGEARVPFPAAAETTYWFQVTDTLSSGAVAFALTVQGSTVMASTGEDGSPAAGQSLYPQVSANGRYVAFASEGDLTGHGRFCYSDHHPAASTGFISLPTPGPCLNIYVRDLVGGTTILASPSTSGQGGGEDSVVPAISADGRYVAFYSWAADLVPNDTNGTIDVFHRDLVTGTTERVSVDSAGNQVHDPDYPATVVISADGRYVGFGSGAPELGAPVKTAGCAETTCYQTFVRDLLKGTTTLVSVDEEGEFLTGDSIPGGMSADGSRVLLNVDISRYVFGSTSAVVVDWRTRKLHQVSRSSDGESANGSSFAGPVHGMSANGRYVTFYSDASNLAEEPDTNGAVDVFVHDLATSRTRRVSVSSAGGQSTSAPDTFGVANPATSSGFISTSISANGRYVVFSSTAPDLVPGDTNGTYDVFIHDLVRGTTERASVLNDGTQSSKPAYAPTISANGRVVAFSSKAFRPEDDPALTAVYVRQRPAA